jgi:hypothetical protein
MSSLLLACTLREVINAVESVNAMVDLAKFIKIS